MCGIAGFCGNYDAILLEKMTNVVAHRGPDDYGIWYNQEKGVGLGHRRLSIIDLSSLGRQPMWDVTGTAVIVYNGEIYNYRELRSDLEKDGFHFKTRSDTEVLLNLFLRDDKRMLSQLNGIFAFAIWDTRHDVLFLARDGVGVKPLYYAETTTGFLFASELKSLLQNRQLDRTLNPHAVHNYLTYLWCPPPDTMLKSVKKLEPGYALRLRNGRVHDKWRYYDLPYDQGIEDISAQKAVEQIRCHVRTAVQRQMVADVPVGAFLSGGLDSSSVVAMARKFTSGRRLQCFTIGFSDDTLSREGFADDLPYAQRVAEFLDVDLHTIRVGPEMAEQFAKVIYHLDEPQGDPAPFNVLLISQLAREHNIKVLLSGAGGDDIFGGYRRHHALMLEPYWAWLPKSIRRGLRRITKLAPTRHSWGRRAAKAFSYADLDGDERISSYFHWVASDKQETFYGPALQEILTSVPFSQPLMATLSGLPHDVERLNRMLYVEGKHFLPDHNLNYTDKMSMATGVEVRVPLLDPDLIAIAARLPVSYKQRGRIGKWIFKKAMEPYLPNDIIYRPKTGIGAPLRRWLRHELCPVVEDVLSQDSVVRRGLFNFRGVQRLMEMDRTGRMDGTYTIFALVCIENWCRMFIDNKIPVCSY